MRHVHTRPAPGESACFHFETTWRVADPIEDVWDVIVAVDDWSQWWPGVTADRTGDRARVVVRNPLGLSLGLTLTIADIDAPRRVELDVDGDLRGHGTWELDETGPLTVLDAIWCVTTRRLDIRLLRPVAARLHALVMRAGEHGLRQRVQAAT